MCTFVITIYSYISGTCAMEGFDARRVSTLLSIDDSKYSIPMIISIGKICMYISFLSPTCMEFLLIFILRAYLCMSDCTYEGYVQEQENDSINNGVMPQPRFEFEDVFYGESYGEELIMDDANTDN